MLPGKVLRMLCDCFSPLVTAHPGGMGSAASSRPGSFKTDSTAEDSDASDDYTHIDEEEMEEYDRAAQGSVRHMSLPPTPGLLVAEKS